MKHLVYIITVLITLLVVPSCGSSHEEHEQQDHADHAHDAADTHAQHNLDGMSLNNGSKWMMDDHTRLVFSAMASTFMSTDPASMSPEELQSLGSSLQQSNTTLIQGCTMTGDAHDQLHIFLSGYIPAVNSLADAGQIDDANTIRQYLEGYDEYFE